MKKLSKILALLCLAALMCTLFVACQPETQNEEEEPTMKFIFFNQM